MAVVLGTRWGGGGWLALRSSCGGQLLVGLGTAPPRLAALCGRALRRRSGGETALPALGGWCLRDGADSDN